MIGGTLWKHTEEISLIHGRTQDFTMEGVHVVVAGQGGMGSVDKIPQKLKLMWN